MPSEEKDLEVVIPSLGTETEAKVFVLYVDVGDTVDRGELIADLWTDLGEDIEIKSPCDGLVLSLHGEEQDEVQAGDVLAVIRPTDNLDDEDEDDQPVATGGSGFLDAALGLGGLFLGALWVAFMLFVVTGGNSYRKDCISDQGRVESSWSFSWYAPIPFVFRPSEDGCEVHTGARVLLDKAGLFTFADPSVAGIGAKAAEDSSDENVAYFTASGSALTQYTNDFPKATTIGEALDFLNTLDEQLKAVDPPAQYETIHNDLLAAISRMQATAAKAQAFAASGDQAAYNRMKPRNEADEKAFGAAVEAWQSALPSELR